ncbi:MAG: phosphoribosylamine--glycine ligase [Burkholderiaceae bacterium]
MKLLVVGGGGREHALAWSLAASARVEQVYVAPGNGGTAREPGVINLPITDTEALIAFCRSESIAFAVVGPEAPLAAGIVDAFRAAGIPIFGPTRSAARLESSKDFAKAFMLRHGIPTAAYRTFTDAAKAHAYLDERGAPIVIKADGLAAGKGVVVAASADEAHAAIDMMLTDGGMGAAGARVVIEDCLFGEEASFIALVDGEHVLALASSQDHKRLLDGDQGPNTGGMGAYSPAPVVTDAVHERIMNEVMLPAVRGMQADGERYTGFLYAGLMIGADGSLNTLEFNCRMGDPETQPIMMRLRSDLATVIEAAIAGRLHEITLDWDPRPALGVVMAAAGYPGSPRNGDPIDGLPADGNSPSPDCQVFHAGTRLQNGHIESAGGRVLCVTALGTDLAAARAEAYRWAGVIRFDGAQFRTEIGHRALGAQGKA